MNDFALTGLCDETKDYLKMLHSIAIGEWSQETLPEDDEALKQQIAPLCVRLTRCVAASFIPTVCLHASPTSLFGIDVSLVAVSLATLFAIVRRGDLATVMDKECLVDIFQECLRRIVDPRLGATSGDCSPRSMESSKETIQQIVRALNIVLLRLAAEAPSGLVLGSLIQVLYLCIPVQEVEHSGPIPALPSASMKPTSRLLLRVLGEEAKKPDPFGAPLDLKGLLMDLHTFFSNQPKIGTVDDTPLTAVKVNSCSYLNYSFVVLYVGHFLYLCVPTISCTHLISCMRDSFLTTIIIDMSAISWSHISNLPICRISFLYLPILILVYHHLLQDHLHLIYPIIWILSAPKHNKYCIIHHIDVSLYHL